VWPPPENENGGVGNEEKKECYELDDADDMQICGILPKLVRAIGSSTEILVDEVAVMVVGLVVSRNRKRSRAIVIEVLDSAKLQFG